MLLPHFKALGWQVTVLAVSPEEIASPVDSFLSETLPPDVEVVRVKALSLRKCRRFGLGNLGWRALPALRRAGNRLLETGDFSVIYFSTTQFACLPLGRYWKNRYEVPYVIDLQDPWVNSFYHQPGAPRPPGGWKYKVARAFALGGERWTLRKASHTVSVSPAYLRGLDDRYAWFDPARQGTVIPFGWSRQDLEAARRMPAPAGTSRQLPHTIVYYGRLGEDMRPLLRWFFEALAEAGATDAKVAALPISFIGTSYASVAAGGGIATEEADSTGIRNPLTEQADRVGFGESLHGLLHGKASLILGSTDLGYTPSKIGPTIAANRPWLAVVDSKSETWTRIHQHGVSMDSVFCRDRAEDARRLVDWLQHLSRGDMPVAQYASPQGPLPDEAATLARQHVDIFNQCIAPPGSPSQST